MTLPSNWTEVQLGKIASTRLGKMLSKKSKTGVGSKLYLRNKNVQWGRFDLSDVAKMDFLEEEFDRFRLRSGDLLVCEGGEVGRAAVWKGQLTECYYQKALHRVRPHAGISSDYLRYALEHLAGSGQLDQHVTGSTIKHLPQEDLRLLRIPVPPTAEQARIVGAIEKHLSHLDAGVESLARIRRKLCEIHASILEAAASAGRLVPLETLLIESPTNGRSVPTATSDAGFPVLRLTALRDGRIVLRERKMGVWTAEEARPFLVRQGDFFVARGNGSLTLVGRGGLVENPPDPIAFPDTMIRFRLDPEQIQAGFLRLIWDSRLVRRQIEAAARTTAGIYKVNQKDLRQLMIPLPQSDAQQDIIESSHGWLSVLDRVADVVGSATTRANSLRKSLLSEALSGRLVPQDPMEEPASSLVERIAATLTTLAPVHNGRGPAVCR